MAQDKLERLRELETIIEQLKEARVRASERLSSLRQQRDEYVEELKSLGVDPTNITAQLKEMENSINTEIESIEAQIPPNLSELLADETNSTSRE